MSFFIKLKISITSALDFRAHDGASNRIGVTGASIRVEKRAKPYA